MINRNFFRARAAVAASLLLTALALAAGPAAVSTVGRRLEPQDLFVSRDKKKIELTESQASVLEQIEKEGTADEVQVVEINTELLTTSPVGVKLNIRPGRRLDLFSIRVRGTAENFTWLGEAAARGDDDAVLVVRDGNVTGTVRKGEELYSIRPLGGGLHAIIKQSPSKFPPEHPPEFERKEKEPVERPDLTNRDEAPPDTIHTLRILVAYTPKVAAARKDIAAYIDVAIAETNRSYTNSKVNIRAELAHAHEVDYKESGNHDTDVANFLNKGDSIMDEVHELRDTHKADVCVLLIDDKTYCGTADRIMATEDRAFAVVHYNCATAPFYSFGHEIGHLQGARHNMEADNGTPFDYGHGYYNAAKKWRTMMSLDCPDKNCDRRPYWSNPNVKFKGAATGSEAHCNNSKVLNETAATVTSFRN